MLQPWMRGDLCSSVPVREQNRLRLSKTQGRKDENNRRTHAVATPFCGVYAATPAALVFFSTRLIVHFSEAAQNIK